jgi:hypothetical protein
MLAITKIITGKTNHNKPTIKDAITHSRLRILLNMIMIKYTSLILNHTLILILLRTSVKYNLVISITSQEIHFVGLLLVISANI